LADRSEKSGKVRASFIDRGVHQAAEVISGAYLQWETASRKGWLQGLDARVKVFFLLYFVVVISLKRDILSEATIGIFVLAMAALSRIDFFLYLRRVLLLGFVFGFLVALPSALNVVRDGRIILPLFELPASYTLWLYHIPRSIGLTLEGLSGVALLTLRVMNSLAVSLLVLFTTPFPEIIRALKTIKVPDVVLVMLTLSYKYIFLFARTVEEMHLAKRSRYAGGDSGALGRNWIAGRVAFLFRRTQVRCEDVFKAMTARGFSEDIRLHGFNELALADWSACLLFALAGALFMAW